MCFTQVTKIQFIAVLMLGLVSCSNSTTANPVADSKDSKKPESPKAIVSPNNSPGSKPAAGNISRIADLQKAPRQSTVFLQGKVGRQAPIVGGTIYELQDGTGSIWVVARQTTSKPGEEVSVRGILRYESIPLNGKEQGSLYVEQQEPVQASPAVKS